MFKGKGRDDFLGRKEFRCGDIPTNVESEVEGCEYSLKAEYTILSYISPLSEGVGLY